ncbi:hypothetical protein D0Y65_045341, partial [Glycine soja]
GIPTVCSSWNMWFAVGSQYLHQPRCQGKQGKKNRRSAGELCRGRKVGGACPEEVCTQQRARNYALHQ